MQSMSIRRPFSVYGIYSKNIGQIQIWEAVAEFTLALMKTIHLERSSIMKISEMILHSIIKKGLVMESKNFETSIDIPDSNVTVTIKAEHMTVKVDKTEA